jgi:hypothetical protein
LDFAVEEFLFDRAVRFIAEDRMFHGFLNQVVLLPVPYGCTGVMFYTL